MIALGAALTATGKGEMVFTTEGVWTMVLATGAMGEGRATGAGAATVLTTGATGAGAATGAANLKAGWAAIWGTNWGAAKVGWARGTADGPAKEKV